VVDDVDRVTRLVHDRLLPSRQDARVTAISFHGTMLQYRITWGQDVDHGVVDGVRRMTAADGYGFYLGKLGKDARVLPYPGCATAQGMPEDGWIVRDHDDDAIVDLLERCLMWKAH
jgi:hypothetical protein